jgi:hypothetical protein
MHVKSTLRTEFDSFVRTGWMAYVLQVGGWWVDNGCLNPIRRNNLPEAYQQIRQVVFDDLLQSRTLYRTLLLPEDFDPGSMLSSARYFGRYWTDDPGVAHEYRPRRCYQTDHPMPDKGVVYVVCVKGVVPNDIDWIATVGCRLTNPTLSEVRLKPGTQVMATSISRAWGFDDQLIASTPPCVGIAPVAEGPGFIENLAALNSAERLRA